MANYYLRLGWSIVRHRFKTPFAEVDLLVRDECGQLAVIEVKRVKHRDFKSDPVTAQQLARLKRACLYLGAESLLVAAVGQDDRVEVLERF